MLHPPQRLIHILGHLVDVMMGQASLRPPLIHLHNQADTLIHGDGQGLRAAHFPQPGREHPFALQRGPARLACRRGKRLEGALQNALGADVNPTAGRHLAIHDQPLRLPLVKILLGGPVGHNIGVGDEHPRRIAVGAKDGNRFAALHQQGLIVL